ncbi:MAG: DUF4870 domain-containing protein [Thermocaproicibacter melissae]|jgi:uncharacterized membrane protein|uniref:DUF4870 domain-containing protein n=1 Tax=Thermocaproicibacter melissae TaxID=2966552 RepID=UPI0024B1418D|nr:hypothetical protein [Thermocaproicibacter melissae]WBY64416.1 hypothetical protein NOG13_01500 [Thermocaproicibacter melissae]
MNGFYGEQYDPIDVQNNRAVSVLAYIPFLFFLPLVVHPDSRYGRFHANQGLVLLLVWVIVHFILKWIPLIGWILNNFFSLFMFLLVILGMVRAYSGRAVPLPFIGQIEIIK